MRTINVPLLDKRGKRTGGLLPVQGHVAWLTLGDSKHRFFIQLDGAGDPEYLTDYASGGTVAKLKPLALELYVGNPYSKYTPRRLAEIALGRLIDGVGAEKIIRTIGAAERIND
jgi:hypothetical protein